jgi:hypothetical protein
VPTGQWVKALGLRLIGTAGLEKSLQRPAIKRKQLYK